MSRLRRSPDRPKIDVMLIDGMNLAYRIVHTCGNLKKDEEYTGVIYKFLNSLQSYILEFIPKQVIVVFEGRGSRERRKSIYPEYKAHRKSELPIPKKAFYQQVDEIKDILFYLGVTVISIDTFEADDVIAVIANNVEKQHLIVSNDGDYLQLISPNVKVYNPITKIIIEESNFREVAGVNLIDFLDHKCMTGDKSDNIKGVVGVGEAKATEICNWMGYTRMLESGYENIPKHLQKAFTPEAIKQFKLANQLIDLSLVPLSLEEVLDNLVHGSYNEAEASDLLEDWNMWSILDNFNIVESTFGSLKEVV